MPGSISSEFSLTQWLIWRYLKRLFGRLVFWGVAVENWKSTTDFQSFLTLLCAVFKSRLVPYRCFSKSSVQGVNGPPAIKWVGVEYYWALNDSTLVNVTHSVEEHQSIRFHYLWNKTKSILIIPPSTIESQLFWHQFDIFLQITDITFDTVRQLFHLTAQSDLW